MWHLLNACLDKLGLLKRSTWHRNININCCRCKAEHGAWFQGLSRVSLVVWLWTCDGLELSMFGCRGSSISFVRCGVCCGSGVNILPFWDQLVCVLSSVGRKCLLSSAQHELYARGFLICAVSSVGNRICFQCRCLVTVDGTGPGTFCGFHCCGFPQKGVKVVKEKEEQENLLLLSQQQRDQSYSDRCFHTLG